MKVIRTYNCFAGNQKLWGS